MRGASAGLSTHLTHYGPKGCGTDSSYSSSKGGRLVLAAGDRGTEQQTYCLRHLSATSNGILLWLALARTAQWGVGLLLPLSAGPLFFKGISNDRQKTRED
jgi:hypothetical protein